MADTNGSRTYRTYDSPRAPQGGQPAQGSDPLAELARLIGQSDPFAERERDAARANQSAPAQDWDPHANAPDRGASAASDHYSEPVSAPIAADPRYYAEQSYDHAAEQADAAQGEAYPTGYDAYYESDQSALDDAEYQEDLARRRRQWRLATVLGIVGLAVLGGAAAYGYRTYFVHLPKGGAPPVIMADTGPTKVIPAAKPADPSANKVSYERVGEISKSEKVVPREEKPVDVKAVAVTPPRVVHTTPEPMAPIAVAPPAATIPVSGQSAKAVELPTESSSSMPNGSGAILPSPRKVKTVSIRPDMSIVGSANAAAMMVAPPERAVASSHVAAPPQASVPMRSVKLAPSVPPVTHVVAPAPPPQHAPSPRPVRGAMAPLSLTPGDAEPARSPSATNSTRAPVALASANPSAAMPAGVGGYAVQVSSQRSEADAKASFKALQARYPNVLGSRQSYVSRADLGGKGVYFRTLVGPFASADQAAAFCTSLKAAGGQCLIHRN